MLVERPGLKQGHHRPSAEANGPVVANKLKRPDIGCLLETHDSSLKARRAFGSDRVGLATDQHAIAQGRAIEAGVQI